MNPYLEQRLEAIHGQLKAAHAGGDAMSSATRGNEREAFVDLLLRGCLPSPYRFGSGEVTDAYGERSGQLDLVIEHPFFPSFPLLGTSQYRLYLVEAIAMAIEVKSSCTQFDDAIATMKKLQALKAGADWPKPVQGAVPNLFQAWAHGPVGMGWSTCFPGRIGFAVVLYEGWKNAETLRQHCDEADLDVALQIDPPIFYARRYRCSGADDKSLKPKVVTGPGALAVFVCIVTEELRALSHWESNIYRRYFEQVPATTS